MIFSWELSNLSIVYLDVFFFVLILLGILWASWICNVLSYIDFRKVSAIISSNIFSLLFVLCPFLPLSSFSPSNCLEWMTWMDEKWVQAWKALTSLCPADRLCPASNVIHRCHREAFLRIPQVWGRASNCAHNPVFVSHNTDLADYNCFCLCTLFSGPQGRTMPARPAPHSPRPTTRWACRGPLLHQLAAPALGWFCILT